jgi:acyl-CoA synthetase (AMP-forming)/AMP-acid ligase II
MTTLASLLKKNYYTQPQKTALILQHAGQIDHSITYAHLMGGALRYARAYEQAGIIPNEVVVLILQHGEDLIYSFWGAILYGAIPSIMPFLTEKLSPERYRTDLGMLVEITRPTAIVTYPEFEAEVRAALMDDSSVRMILLTHQIGPVTEPDFVLERWLQRSSDEIALVQHSSGTTGLQKGVALSHRAVLNQLSAYSDAIELVSSDVFVSWLPLYHDMGLIAGFLIPILSGNTLVLMSPFDWVRGPYRLFQNISKYGGTLSWMPNFAYNFCAKKIRDRDLEGVDLSSCRMVINCSEPVKYESHRAFYERFKAYGLRETALSCSYAMAENVFGVTQTLPGQLPIIDDIDSEAYFTQHIAIPPINGKPILHIMSSGRVIANTRIRILDEEGVELPERAIGEIALQSNCLLTEYYNRSDITLTAFRDGWYLTGDYGYHIKDEIFVTGRKKDIIIVGGKNIYPQDLEALAYEVPGIHAGRAVVFGIEDADSGTEVVVLVAETTFVEAEERRSLANILQQHVTKNSAITLRHVYLVGPKWIIKTSSGKTARSANRQKYLEEMALWQHSAPV